MSKELIRLRDLCMAFDDELVLDHINLTFISMTKSSSHFSDPAGAARPPRCVSLEVSRRLRRETSCSTV